MAAKSSIRLDGLLQNVGQSILDAQVRIDKATVEQSAGTNGLRTGVAIAETEVEVKLLFDEDPRQPEGVLIRPVSSTLTRETQIDPAVLSTLKARLVAVPDEQQRPPARKPSDVRDDILRRPDLQRLARILGPLEVRTTYVAGARRWLADVVEPGGQTVRSLQVDDVNPR